MIDTHFLLFLNCKFDSIESMVVKCDVVTNFAFDYLCSEIGL